MADDYGSKSSIWLFLGIASILFVGLSVLNNHPNAFNYPAEITEDNYKKQYTRATQLIRYLKTSIAMVFGLIIFEIFQHVDGQSTGLSLWMLPIILGLIFIPIVIFIYKSMKERQ